MTQGMRGAPDSLQFGLLAIVIHNFLYPVFGHWPAVSGEKKEAGISHRRFGTASVNVAPHEALDLLDTGLRVSELCHLQLDDVWLEDGLLKVLGKGNSPGNLERF